MTPEIEHLEQLVKHPGWLLLLARARKEVGGTGYALRIKQAIAKAQADKTDIAMAVQMVDAATDAVNAILSWPESELKRLVPAEPEVPSMMRGGR